MALTQAQVRFAVRKHTTSDTTLVDDATIDYFAGFLTDFPHTDNTYDEGLDLYGVIADVWNYISLQDHYMSEQVGQVAVSRPLALARAAYYMGLSRRGTGGGMQSGVYRRGDLLVPTADAEVEFGA